MYVGTRKPLALMLWNLKFAARSVVQGADVCGGRPPDTHGWPMATHYSNRGKRGPSEVPQNAACAGINLKFGVIGDEIIICQGVCAFSHLRVRTLEVQRKPPPIGDHRVDFSLLCRSAVGLRSPATQS